MERGEKHSEDLVVAAAAPLIHARGPLARLIYVVASGGLLCGMEPQRPFK